MNELLSPYDSFYYIYLRPLKLLGFLSRQLGSWTQLIQQKIVWPANAPSMSLYRPSGYGHRDDGEQTVLDLHFDPDRCETKGPEKEGEPFEDDTGEVDEEDVHGRWAWEGGEGGDFPPEVYSLFCNVRTFFEAFCTVLPPRSLKFDLCSPTYDAHRT